MAICTMAMCWTSANAAGLAIDPGRSARRLEVVMEAAKLDMFRMLCWILAWTGLSAAWFLSDGDPMAEIALYIARLAAAEIDRMC